MAVKGSAGNSLLAARCWRLLLLLLLLQLLLLLLASKNLSALTRSPLPSAGVGGFESHGENGHVMCVLLFSHDFSIEDPQME